MLRRALPAALLLVLLAAPVAQAEFGHESHDGWPVNAEGEVLRPPVDYGGMIAGPLNKAGGFTLYPYYPLLTAEVTRLAQEHPDLVKLTSAGKSTAGLDMWLLEIADFARIEAGEGVPLEEREVLYIDGGTHSNEYSGVYFVTEIASFLLDEYATNETAKWIVENRHVWILPMVNPDGSNAFGRLNAKLVNVNRNFPGTWGTVEEDPIVNNPGAAPASEVETQVVISIMERTQPDYVNSIHCCGNLWLHPYGAEELENPRDLQMFTRICDEAFAEVREDCGEIWSTIYPASGTTADEGYERVGASSWTYEMSGRGRIAGPWGEPAVNRDVREQEHESWNGILHAFLNVEKYGARPKVVDVRGDAARLSVTVANVGYGNLTFGNVTVAGAAQPLPALLPNETATLVFEGAFAPGNLTVGVDWVKRERHMTPGALALDVPLVETAEGLVGVLPDAADPISQTATRPIESVPGAPLALAVLAVAALAVALRRR
ncbi:MAG TPA: M14 family metallopeptidase [Candidatus Thermoplasmatota archaeon]|nr:M14 family metallopeptidase [Candidatus Thermoplasmatota archaeon]